MTALNDAPERLGTRWVAKVAVPVLALAVLGFGLFLVLDRQQESVRRAPSVGQPRSQAESTSGVQPAAVTKAEVEMLHAQVAGLQEQLLADAKERQEVAAAAAEDAPEAPPRIGLGVHEIQVRYSQIFEQESVDRSWALAEERTLASAFQGNGDLAAGKVETLECRQTMCRARLSFQDAEQQRRFIGNIGMPPLDKGAFWKKDPEGMSVTLYAPREANGLRDVTAE